MLILIGVFLFGLLLFHQLERWRPVLDTYQTGAKRRGYLADLMSTFVNGPGLSALEKIAFTWMVTLVPSWKEFMGGWAWLAQFAVFFLVNDFSRYWIHRWYHDFGLLWRVHRVHHTVVEMDALSVFRHHVLEAIVKNGLLFLPFRLLGVDDSVIIAYSSLDILKGYWHHANFRTYIGPLNYILNSPELHWWHHSCEARGQRANYGSVLSVWDWLFKTAYWPRGQWPTEIGVEGLPNFPDTFVGQLTSIRLDDEAALAAYGASPQERPASASDSQVDPGYVPPTRQSATSA